MLSNQNVSSEMFAFILTIVGLYSDESSGSMPAVMSISSTMRLLASRAIGKVRNRLCPVAIAQFGYLPGVCRSFDGGTANWIVLGGLIPP